MQTATDETVAAVAGIVSAALESRRQIAPLSASGHALTLGDAYRVTARLNRARDGKGERTVGRKIGFTNRTIWAEYGVYAPIWGYVTDRSLYELTTTEVLPLAPYCEPRIEPEIVFGLARAPSPDMDEAALAGCIDWIAHGFEVVQSIYPNWKFTPADTIACNGLHGALIVGPRQPFQARADEWRHEMATFDIELQCNGVTMDRGGGALVLDSPLKALGHLVGLLTQDHDNPPLRPGEIVTTGTLTRALPIAPGEIWRTRLTGLPIAGIKLRFA
jgi:2-oxo-3-hexenedioate decarboxylase